MKLLAIDPGACTGFAYFVDGELKACGSCTPDELGPTEASTVVIESPRIYPRSPVPPNDIVTLARIVGRYQERFRSAKVVLIAPREWKGTIAKKIMLARIRAALTTSDLGAVWAPRTTDDTIDAIGLGKWYLANRCSTCSSSSSTQSVKF